MDKKGETRGGFYWADGKPYVAVTNVLKVLDKPALRYWFGKEVFLAMVEDPTLNQKAALSAPYKTSNKAKMRGTTIHSIVEAYKATGKVIDTVPKEFRGYIEGFYSWINDAKVKIKENEKTVYSDKHGYAGTLDILAGIGGSIWVVDVKTGKDIYPESWLQLSAYKQAVEESGKKVDEIAVLLLRENGKYKFEKGTGDFDVFLACKKLWEWQNQEIYTRFTRGGDKHG